MTILVLYIDITIEHSTAPFDPCNMWEWPGDRAETLFCNTYQTSIVCQGKEGTRMEMKQLRVHTDSLDLIKSKGIAMTYLHAHSNHMVRAFL